MTDPSLPRPDERPLPASPVPPAASPPAAPPAYAPPPAAPTGWVNPTGQPGYAPRAGQPGYAAPAPQPGYAPPPAQPGYAPAAPHPGYTPGYVAPAPRPTSGLAITSLVCGIAGVVLFWAVLPIIASIVAVVTGHMALGQLRRQPGLGGRGLAIAGLILGYVMVAVLAITLVTSVLGFLFVGAFTLPFVFAR